MSGAVAQPLLSYGLTGISVYQDWGGWASVSGANTYAPGKAAVDAGNTGVVLIVVGQSITGNPPATPLYGGNAPDISLTGASGACWMLIWHLSITPPVNNTLNLGAGSANFNAMVLTGVVSNASPHQAGFGVPPRTDVYASVAVGNYIVGAGKAVNGQVPVMSSNDPGTTSTSTSGNPYSNGEIEVFWQAPTSGAVIYTWTTGGGPINNLISVDFSP